MLNQAIPWQVSMQRRPERGWGARRGGSYMARQFKTKGHTDGQQTSREGLEQGQGTRMTDCNGQPLDTEAIRRQKKRVGVGGHQMMRKQLVIFSRLSWCVSDPSLVLSSPLLEASLRARSLDWRQVRWGTGWQGTQSGCGTVGRDVD